MSYSPRKQERLFFDIETKSNPETCALMPEPKAPANYTDPVKIAKWIEDAKAEAIDKAALDPDYGRVLSIGYSLGGTVVTLINSDVYGMTGKTNDPDEMEFAFLPEENMLHEFWNELMQTGGHCVGFNILGFDLPFLMRRSMALGVKIPQLPVLAKFRTEPVTDLMAILYNWGADKYKGLKQIARLYQLPVLCPDVDGAMVSRMNPDDLRVYQTSDVMLVIALHARMNGVYFNH